MKNRKKHFSKIFYLAMLILLACFFSSSAHADTPTPIFQESFDNLDEVTANGASSHDNLTFEAGKTGNGVRLTGKANLIYPATGRLTNPKSDIDGDGQVTAKDLGILMSQWKP